MKISVILKFYYKITTILVDRVLWWVSQRGFGFPLTQAHKRYGELATGLGLGPFSEIRYRSGPIRRWSRHPDKSRDTLVQQLDPMEVPSSRLQRTGSEAGYRRLNVHPILRSAPCVFVIYYLLNYPIIPWLPCNSSLPSINWSFLI